MEEGYTAKCKICGRAYVIYSFYAGDQSACPQCRDEARRAVKREDTPEQIRRRKEHYQ